MNGDTAVGFMDGSYTSTRQLPHCTGHSTWADLPAAASTPFSSISCRRWFAFGGQPPLRSRYR